MSAEGAARLEWLGDDWTTLSPEASGWARGYAFVGDSECLEDDEILGHLLAGRARLAETVAAMNGCFAAVLDARPAPVLVADRYATTPLYLHRRAGALLAAPDPWSVAAALEREPELDELAVLDLLRTSYVLGTRTLLRGVETLPPASIAVLEPSGPRVERYWHYGYAPAPRDADDAARGLAEVFARLSARTIRHLERRGRRMALTLSGGLDSRVLAATLGAAATTPPVALSYGTPGNPEVEVAQRVAAALGMEHRAAAITEDYLNDDFLRRSVREVGATTRFTCGVGVRHLDARGLDTLIPGHTGDFVSGGHLPAHTGMVRSPEQLLRYLELTHFRYLGSEAALRGAVRLDYDAVKRRTLEATIADFDFGEDVLGLIDRWNVENRQRRMILMELRAYEAVGRWMLPFYDHELVDFFASLPHELRLGQRLYIDTAAGRLFTGRAGGLAELERIGAKHATVDAVLPRRLARLQRLQPLSGWVLQYALAGLRDLARRLRPPPERQHDTDPFKAWYRERPAVRAFVDARLEAMDDGLIDPRALRSLLTQDAEERIFNRLLPGALTAQECLDQARGAWSSARDT